MIVQPREPGRGSMLEHVCDADARYLEEWPTDTALWLDEHGRIRIDYVIADRYRAARDPRPAPSATRQGGGRRWAS